MTSNIDRTLPSETEVLRYFESLSNWNRWGKEDEIGTLNFISSAQRIAAVKLIREGEPVSCSLPVSKFRADASAEFAGQGTLPFVSFMITSGERWGSQEPNEIQVAREFIGLTIHGYNYTHLDSLGHIFWDGRTYNGHLARVVTEEEGATKLGVQNWKHGIQGRGILLDVRRLRPPNGDSGLDDVVYLSDFLALLDMSGLEVQTGDILLHRVGIEEGLVRQGHVGFHPEILPWFHAKEVAVIGGDSGHDPWSPTIYPNIAHPIHQVAIVAMGLPLLDILQVEDLARMCTKYDRWEFHLTINPLVLVNATGSPVNPIATF